MAKLSFVIPAYNAVDTLGETINSIRAQTVRDIEIIVIDDCSTDDTQELMNFFCKEDKRIKYKRLPKRGERSNARNIGNRLATAPIICVNDADDISFRERAKETLKGLKKADVFYSAMMILDNIGRIQYKMKTEPFDIERIKKDDNYYTKICHSSMAYKKTNIKYTSGEWAKLGIDDWKFQMDLYKSGAKFKHSNKYLIGYRTSENATMLNRDNNKVMKLKGEYIEKV